MKNTKEKTEHQASVRMNNLPISTKHCVEISNYLRYKNTNLAKKFLEDVSTLKKAVPFKRFNRDRGHKPGMAAGRYPQKAAKEFLRLIKSAVSNAQDKGLNTSNLKIVKIMANKASVPLTGGRNRHGTKRTHLEIIVKEGKISEKTVKKTAKNVKVIAEKPEAKKETTPVKEESKPEVKEQAKPEVKPVEEKTVPKEEPKQEKPAEVTAQ